MHHYIKTLSPSSVVIGERHRKIYRNIEELADSIRDQGLIHPPTLDEKLNLIAGGRRMAALLMLEKSNPSRFSEVNFNVMPGEITPGTLRILELTENSQREDMTWTEKVTCIGEAHELMVKETIKKGDGKWHQEQTGKLFGVAKSSVSNALKLYSAILSGDKEIMECQNPLEALRLLVSRVEDAARAEIVKRQTARASSIAKGPETQLEGGKPALVGVGPIEGKGNSTPSHDAFFENSGEPLAPALDKVSPPHFNVLDFYHLGDCLTLLDNLSAKVDAIITDPPYAIDMGNLTNASRVEHTHKVEENLSLLPAFITKAFTVLSDNGVLIMWYDLEHHNFLVDHAKKVGFKPCAWPLVWCKTSPCHNQAPQYNATKSTEVALVLRKGNYTLPKPIVNNFLLAKNEKNASHPFFKPIQVWEWLILNFTKKGDVVLDPFAGEGSCILTLLLNQRVPLAFEIDPNHFNTAVTSLPSLYEKELSNRKTISDFFD